MCSSIGRDICTPDTDIDGQNLQEELLSWLPLPIPNPSDKDHYLPANATKNYIETKSLSFKGLKRVIQDSKTNSVERKVADGNKRKDNNKQFVASKVRIIAVYDTCGASRCVYSKYAIRAKNGPTKK